MNYGRESLIAACAKVIKSASTKRINTPLSAIAISAERFSVSDTGVGLGTSLAGLKGGPLVWGTVLVGSCLLDCRKATRNAAETSSRLKALAQRLHDIEQRSRSRRDLHEMIGGLVDENRHLQTRLRQGNPDDEPLAGAYADVLAELGEELQPPAQAVQAYLEQVQAWIDPSDELTDEVLYQAVESRASPLQIEQLALQLIEGLEVNIEPRQADELARCVVSALTSTGLTTKPRKRGASLVVLRWLESLAMTSGSGAVAATVNVAQANLMAAQWAIVIGKTFRAIPFLERTVQLAPAQAWPLILWSHVARSRYDFADSDRLAQSALDVARTSGDDHYVALALCSLGDLRLSESSHREALACYEQCIVIQRRLVGTDPSSVHRQLETAVTLAKLAKAHAALNQHGLAIDAFTEAAGIHQRIAEADPANTRWQRKLAWALFALGAGHLFCRSLPDAMMFTERAADIAARMLANDPRNAMIREDLAGYSEIVDWLRTSPPAFRSTEQT